MNKLAKKCLIVAVVTAVLLALIVFYTKVLGYKGSKEEYLNLNCDCYEEINKLQSAFDDYCRRSDNYQEFTEKDSIYLIKKLTDNGYLKEAPKKCTENCRMMFGKQNSRNGETIKVYCAFHGSDMHVKRPNLKYFDTEDRYNFFFEKFIWLFVIVFNLYDVIAAIFSEKGL